MPKAHIFNILNNKTMIGITCLACGEGHALTGWHFNGDVDRPTFSPSLLVTGKRPITNDEAARIINGESLDIPDRVCHSFIVDGNIQYLSDCTHELAGCTIELPEFGDYDSPIIFIGRYKK